MRGDVAARTTGGADVRIAICFVCMYAKCGGTDLAPSLSRALGGGSTLVNRAPFTQLSMWGINSASDPDAQVQMYDVRSTFESDRYEVQET